MRKERQQVTDLPLDKVKELASRGMNQKQIAIELGFIPSTLAKWRRDHKGVEDALFEGWEEYFQRTGVRVAPPRIDRDAAVRGPMRRPPFQPVEPNGTALAPVLTASAKKRLHIGGDVYFVYVVEGDILTLEDHEMKRLLEIAKCIRRKEGVAPENHLWPPPASADDRAFELVPPAPKT